MHTITCHDCTKPVSLIARACPHCGSRHLAGPYRDDHGHSGVEARNDRILIVMVLAFGAIGVLYGVETGSSPTREIFGALCYGFVGVCIAAPLAFAMNVTRNWL